MAKIKFLSFLRTSEDFLAYKEIIVLVSTYINEFIIDETNENIAVVISSVDWCSWN